MKEKKYLNFFILGIFIFLGLSTLGYFLSSSILEYKKLDRSVTVKGLSQKEVEANIVIWPVKFSVADNNLENIYKAIDTNTQKIQHFLEKNGIKEDEVTISTPFIFDKSAQQYSDNKGASFRYTANQIITIYSTNIPLVQKVQSSLSQLGKEGIVFSGNDYDSRIEYIYTKLNELKPQMIEEATKEARSVAQKFAQDSQSKLGKIKKASQGQFTISQRDKNNPHIKSIRVVSTIEYYLSD